MSIKLNRAKKIANVFKGSETLNAITTQLPEQLIEHLSSKDLALVLEVVDRAYKAGKLSVGAEKIDTNAVYINDIDKVIEWHEVGAEYEQVETLENGFKVTRPVKIKEGELVLKFAE